MSNPFDIVRDFEQAMAGYCGSPYAVATTSCTMALLMAVRYVLEDQDEYSRVFTIPKFTYVSVPQSIIHGGGEVAFCNCGWTGYYELKPWNIWDSARYLSSNMWDEIGDTDGDKFICLSFHHTKHLAIGTGGMILHNSPMADKYLRRLRYDGRAEGVAPRDDYFNLLGYHAYMTPEQAARGLTLLSTLPDKNYPIPADGYADLSQFEVFNG